MRTVRTHVKFFNDVDVSKLSKIHDEMFEEWNSRKPFIEENVAVRGDNRLSALKYAIRLLAEDVD